MATRPKRPRDPFQLAKLIGDISTGELEKEPDPTTPLKGRAGGLKGGAARAVVLTPERRRAIAKKAAKARWKVPSED